MRGGSHYFQAPLSRSAYRNFFLPGYRGDLRSVVLDGTGSPVATGLPNVVVSPLMGIARLLVPTGRHYGCLGTILLGIVGSLVGGTLGSVVAGNGFDVSTAGWIGSVIGAVLVLVFIRWRDSGPSR